MIKLAINNLNNIENIVRRNRFQKITAIKEIRETYGYGLVEAKGIVDEILDKIEEETNDSYKNINTGLNEKNQITNYQNMGLKTSTSVLCSILAVSISVIIICFGVMEKLDEGVITLLAFLPCIIVIIFVCYIDKKLKEKNLVENLDDKINQSSIDEILRTIIVGTTHKETTFQIINRDNTQKIVTVKNNSSQFKKYYKYLDK